MTEGLSTVARPLPLAEALARFRKLSGPLLLEAARADQAIRWRAGEAVPAEVYLTHLPDLAADPEDVLVLLCGELLLRAERRETPSLSEYQQRFPHLADRLALLFQMEKAFDTSAYIPPPQPTADGPRAPPIATPVVPPGYEVLAELGRGGMGVVYKARQRALNRVVALKLLLAGPLARPEQLARFRREAEAMARLRHPNLVQVFEVGEQDGRPWQALEFVDGPTLARRCGGMPQPPGEAARLVEVLAGAVHEAHCQGIVHRDLKPANVLLGPGGVPRITDFGLAKWLEGRSDPHSGGEAAFLTATEAYLGTPAYMAPEQAEGRAREAGPAADVYALGAILYELLTGRPPFEGPTPMETMRRVTTEAPVPPRRLRRGLPRDLETVVLKCLEKDPRKRYRSAAALAEDLRRFQAGEPITARPVRAWEHAWLWARRNPGWAAMLTTVAVLLLVIAGGASFGVIRLGESLQKSERRRFESLLAEAISQTRSRRPGQRFEALEKLQEATALARRLGLPEQRFAELRNAAIAALAVPDLYAPPSRVLSGIPDCLHADFDDGQEVCAQTDTHGNCSVRRVAGGQETERLPAPAEEAGKGAWPALSRDGRFVAVRYASGRLQVWKREPAGPRLWLEVADCFMLDFRPDSRRLLVSHMRGASSLYDLTTPDPPSTPVRLAAVAGMRREVNPALHPTEPLVALVSYFASEVQICDLRDGKVIASLPMPGGDCHAVAWHPAGHLLAVSEGDGRDIHLFERATFRRVRTLHGVSGGTRLFFNHAGDRLAASGWSHGLHLFDVNTGELLIQFPGTRNALFHRFSSDDQWLAGEIVGGNPVVRQVADGREYRTLVSADSHRGTRASPIVRDRVGMVTVSPDGRLLAAVLGGGVGFWDLASGAEVGFLNAGETCSVLFEPEPAPLGALLTTGRPGTFRWPIRPDAAAPSGRRIGPPQRLGLPPTGGWLARSRGGGVLAAAARSVYFHQPWAGGWALHAQRPDAPVRVAGGTDVEFVAIDPSGRWLITMIHASGLVQVHDAATGKMLKTIAEGGGGFPTFSPDGRWLAVGGTVGRLFEAGTWEPGLAFNEGPGHKAFGVFSPDGKVIADVTAGGVIRLVEVAGGRELARLEDPDLAVTGSLCFTPDGTRLVASSNDRRRGIRVWDLRRIREGLGELGLDWDAPAYEDRVTSPTGPPLRVQIEDGGLGDPEDALAETPLETIGRTSARLEADPNDGEAWSQRGWARARRGDHARAVADFNEAQRRRPADPHVLVCRAASLRALERPREAVADLEKALTLQPGLRDRAEACNSLAWLYANGPAEVRDTGKAVPLAGEAVRLNPWEADHHNTLGLAWFRAGGLNEARGALEKSVAYQTEATAWDLYVLAMIHQRQGKAEEARRCYERGNAWQRRHKQELVGEQPAEVEALRAEAARELGVRGP
jgi:WD40 repeat protein/Flp pilus assembly protein TadD